MNDFKEKLLLARKKLEAADAVVVGAGAGLSAAAGLDYSGDEYRKELAVLHLHVHILPLPPYAHALHNAAYFEPF